MEGGGGWRMGRYGGVEQDKSLIMNRPVMLRFRPIAPKPVVNGGDVKAVGSKNSVLTAGRTKRKYVRVCKNVGHSRRNTSDKEIGKVVEEPKPPPPKTLQLLPENSGVGGDHPTDGGCWFDLNRSFSQTTLMARDEILISHDNDLPTVQEDHHGSGVSVPNWLRNNVGGVAGGPDPTVVGMQQVRGVLKVECVTGSCIDAQGTVWRCTDAERMMNLEMDTCPGFISDSDNQVQWLNEAFKKMISEQNYTSNIAVWLVVKEKLPYKCAALTCQVKLQYMVGKERCFRMVPCDMWRMDGGGFAWRLDVKAALTLGR